MKLLSFFGIAASFLLLAACAKLATFKQGNKAPDFTLQDETGAWRSLSEFSGKNVVLFFYPHDNSPGCTTQACSFRDKQSLYRTYA